jgi:restriction system protein
MAARQALVEEALDQTARSGPVPAAMDWRMVERLVGDAFRRRGYVVTGFGGTRPDAVAADIGLLRNGERYLVQCRHWRKFRVGVTELIDLSRLVQAQGAAGGFALTTGRFAEEAWAFARHTSLVLYEGPALPWLLDTVGTVRLAIDDAPDPSEWRFTL